MVETLYSKVAPWITANGPESSVVLFTQGCLVRNLADFPFPSACSDEERRLVEERVLNALAQANLMASGQYRASSEFDEHEAAFLAERRLVPFDFFKGRSHGGVYVGEDQSFSIIINGLNHVCILVNGAGLALTEVWNRLNSLDDLLAQSLDFAFDKEYGYLTSSLSHVGTGLKMSMVLHLPGLADGAGGAERESLDAASGRARERRLVLYGLRPMGAPGARRPAGCAGNGGSGEALYFDLTETLYCDYSEAHADLFLLSNQSTLGVNEEEILFHLRQSANELVELEKESRRQLLAMERVRVEDRVARALGIARNARLLSYAEAVSVLSSLRFGLDLGLVEGVTLGRINELFFASQGAHLRMKKGHDCDEWTLSMERATMFRSRFGQDRKGTK